MSILAVGAWLKNTACLLQNGQVQWSRVHGDLSDPDACEALQSRVVQWVAQAQAAGQPVRAIAHDLHPDFFSTQLALRQARVLDVPAAGVQHHHAHTAAVMAEHGLQGPVLGLALDGVGLGTDGSAWGGELLWVQGAQWQRLGHLSTLALPGGDRAAREPWRMAASALHALGHARDIGPRWSPIVGESLAKGVCRMLDVGLNCPHSSSAGRWFDAAAAALGLCVRQHDEAQAALALEVAASRWLSQAHAPVQARTDAVCVVREVQGLLELDVRPLWASLLDTSPTQVDAAAARFHLGLVDGLVQWVQAASLQVATQTVCLGGGCFFNRILRERLTQQLQALGFRVYQPAQQFGDAGLALGQAWVVAQQLHGTSTLRATSTPVSTFKKETSSCV